MEQDLLQQFISETIQKAGFKDVPSDFHEAYLEKLQTLLAQKIGQEATALLSEEDLGELSGLLEKNPEISQDQLFDFYGAHIPNFPEKMATIFKQFQDQYLALAKQVV